MNETDANLKQRLSLYRNLLFLMKAPRSEQELIRFVIDTIHGEFPEHRCTFAWLTVNHMVDIIYSRQPSGMASLTGKRFEIGTFGGIEEKFQKGEPVLVPDVRTAPGLEKFAAGLAAMGGNISRLEVPFSDTEGNIGVISLTNSVPVNWSWDTVDLLVEICELVGLMLREARARDRLHRSEATFRQFAENVGVVFWMSDVEKKEMVYISPAYEAIWGRTTKSLYEDPKSFLDAIHPEDRERVQNAVAHQADHPYDQVYRVVQPGGEIRWVKDRGFRVRDERGHVYRIAGIAEDITALREAQDRLEATQAQVIMNAKLAALGEMASGIAHEINNPLAVIHGLTVQLAELFRKGTASIPMVIDSLGSMEKMANRIAAIVKGLRTFSRQTEGDPLTPADLVSIVQETMAMCEAKLRAADIHVTVTVPMRRLMVRCRSSEISQVLLNLVSNAYDAVQSVKDRAVRIDVREADGKVRLVVEDSGPGIDPARRGRIFQPFYTTKEVGRGTGLGLSISKGIVEAHGGTLYLDTSSPRTRFVVELPAGAT